jgi:serpin B
MKNLLIGTLGAILLASCQSGTPGSNVGTQQSSLARDLHPNPSAADQQALAAGNRAFAMDLFHALATANAGTNLFLSPYSVSIALAMTYGGAAGDTATQMAGTMHFTLPDAGLNQAFDSVDLALASRGQAAAQSGDPFQLSVVNATWGQTGKVFLPAYLDLLAVDYGSGMHDLDFESDPEAARTTINDWVAQQTKDRIQNLLPENSIDDLTRLVLTDAIYFKASWNAPFDTTQTQDGTFTTLAGPAVTVPMMHASGTYPYAESATWQAVELPYVGGDVSMVVIVPVAGSYADVEATMDGDALGTLLASLSAMEGTVTLPQFGVESTFSLKDELTALGMTDAFDQAKADFSGMDGAKDLYISAVFHKSFVAVDEAGTEAAAATAVVVGQRGVAGPPATTFTFVADHPFLFAVIDQPTGAVLFLGRVLDASAK